MVGAKFVKQWAQKPWLVGFFFIFFCQMFFNIYFWKVGSMFIKPWPRGCDVLILHISFKFFERIFWRKKMGGILPNSFQILLILFTLNTLHITSKGSSISFCHHLKVFVKLVEMLFFHYFFFTIIYVQWRLLARWRGLYILAIDVELCLDVIISTSI